jgi:hypothetical protein
LSRESVRAILDRVLNDDAFLQEFERDPRVALGAYDLTEAERETLLDRGGAVYSLMAAVGGLPSAADTPMAADETEIRRESATTLQHNLPDVAAEKPPIVEGGPGPGPGDGGPGPGDGGPGPGDGGPGPGDGGPGPGDGGPGRPGPPGPGPVTAVIVVVAVVVFLPAAAKSPANLSALHQELSARSQAIIQAPPDQRMAMITDMLVFMRDALTP